jgi:hypothetical protein
MKKLILTVVFAVVVSEGLAQNVSNNITVGNLQDLNLLQNFDMIAGFNDQLPDDVVGTKYLIEGYNLGKVVIVDSDEKPSDCFIAYDVLKGVMSVSYQSNGADSFYLTQARNVEVSFDNRSFRYMDFSFNGIQRSNYVELLARLEKGFTLGVLHTKAIGNRDIGSYNTYSSARAPRVITKTELVLIDKDGVAVNFQNSKRTVLKNIPDMYQSQVKSYIKSNNIRFQDDYKGLVAVAKYYASIKN